VARYQAENRHDRKPSWSDSNPPGRWRPHRDEGLIQRDEVSLDIFWLKEESLEDSTSLEDPDVIADDLVEDLRAASEELELIRTDLPSGGLPAGCSNAGAAGGSPPGRVLLAALQRSIAATVRAS
jgi:type I restriction enzyme M protein